jgi:hypothetical protein
VVNIFTALRQVSEIGINKADDKQYHSTHVDVEVVVNAALQDNKSLDFKVLYFVIVPTKCAVNIVIEFSQALVNIRYHLRVWNQEGLLCHL